MTDSVRHLILNKIVTTFEAVTTPATTPDAFFSKIELGPLSEADHRKRYVVGVVPGTEREKFLFPYIECMLTVNVEFRITVNRGDDSPGDVAETVLTLVKQTIMANRTWDSLALDTKIAGSEIDLQTYMDNSVVGLCVCEVQFRHSHLDPTLPGPDV